MVVSLVLFFLYRQAFRLGGRETTSKF